MKVAETRVRRKPGDVVVAKNGYSYTYVQEGKEVKRILTHHLVARKKYGRPPAENERVVFDDGDRTNLDPSNISYAIKNGDTRKALLRRKATLEDKINELQAELDLVNTKLTES